MSDHFRGTESDSDEACVFSKAEESQNDSKSHFASSASIDPTLINDDDNVSMTSKASESNGDQFIIPNQDQSTEQNPHKELSHVADDIEQVPSDPQLSTFILISSESTSQFVLPYDTMDPSVINDEDDQLERRSMWSQISCGDDRLLLKPQNEVTNSSPPKQLSNEGDEVSPVHVPVKRHHPSSLHGSERRKLFNNFVDNIEKIKNLRERISSLFTKATADYYQHTNEEPIIHQETRSRAGTRSIISLHQSERQGSLPPVPPDRHLSFEGDPVMNKIMNDLMYLKEKPSIWTLRCIDLKDIILNLDVSCSLFLTLLGGLPYSGKSTLIQNFLKSALFKPPTDTTIDNNQFIEQYNERSLSRYGVSILGHKPYHELLWFTETLHSLHAFSCGANILHDSLLQGQQVELIDRDICTADKIADVFENQLLNEHISRVYTDIDQILQRADTNPELKRILSSGALFVNIFDVGLGKGVLEFLTLISQYTRNKINFVCLSMDDVFHLNEPPNLNYTRYDDIKESTFKKGTRLLYIIRHATALHFDCPCTSGSHTHTAFIITCDSQCTEEKRKEAKTKLEEALNREAKNRNMLFLHSRRIIVVDPCCENDLQKFKIEFEEAMKDKSSLTKKIKLSWIFLRSALLFSDKMIISYDELETMADELNITSDDLKRFIDQFTKFGSIFYIPTIKALAKYIILKPVLFVNQLSLLFQPPPLFGNDHYFNGLFTEKQIHVLIPDEHLSHLIISTLCEMGLAADTNKSKIDRKHLPTDIERHHPEPLLFVPLAKNGSLSTQTSNESLFIIYDSKVTPPDFQGLFAFELLNNRNMCLVSTTQVNVIKFQYIRSKVDCTFCLIFQSAHIEVLVEHYNQLDVCEKIFSCCMKALQKVQKLLKDFSHRLAIQCLKPQKIMEGENIKKIDFEYLPEITLCYSCEASKSSLRKKWKEIVQDNHDKTIQASDLLTPDKLLDLATEVGKFFSSDSSLVKQLARELGVLDNTEVKTAISQYTSWQRVFIILLAWEKRVGREQATKTKLSRILLRLGYVMLT